MPPPAISTLIASSSIGALITSIIMSPLDVIKVRSQAGMDSAPARKSVVVVHNGLQTCLVPRTERAKCEITNSLLTSGRNIVRAEVRLDEERRTAGAKRQLEL